MSKPQLTEERLRGWLDSNQVQRERLCIDILSLNAKYSDVQPRRPKGGPDGARDIQAVFEEGREAWGAVSFRNSAKDSKDDKTAMTRKFKGDLNSALKANKDLKVFVFFTNVDFTPGETTNLQKYARSKGIEHVDLYNRERVRVVLDQPKGLSTRFQYLDIPLSEAEQRAFFEAYGDDLKVLMSSGFNKLESQVQRLEFLQEANKPLRSVEAIVVFDRPRTPKELGHFRVLFEIINLHERDPHPTLWVASRDSYGTYHSGDEVIPVFGEKMIVWSQGPDEKIQNTIVGGSAMGPGVAPGGYMLGKGPFATVADFDHCNFSILVSKPLVPFLSEIWFMANRYVLYSAASDELEAYDRTPLVDWPEPLTDEEQAVEWCGLMFKLELGAPPWTRRSSGFNFSAYTPAKLDR